MSLDTDFLSGSENRTLVDFNHELMALHKGKTICVGTTCPMFLSSILGHMLFTYLLADKENLGKLQSLIINVTCNLRLHFLNASAFFVTKTYAKLNSRLNRYVYIYTLVFRGVLKYRDLRYLQMFPWLQVSQVIMYLFPRCKKPDVAWNLF